MTRKIIPLLQPGDQFDLVELNEAFAEILQQRFRSDPQWKLAAERSRIHVCPLQEFASEEPYDFIISGLPHNNFPADLLRQVLEAYFQHLAPGGEMTFFEYMYLNPLRGMVSRRNEKARLKTVNRMLSDTFARHRIRRDWVFANVPPAWVQHLRHEPR